MAGIWAVYAEGPDGEPVEVSADGTQVRVDGFVLPVVDVPVVPGPPVDAWGQARPGEGWW